jgi:NADH dehydrogenase (ubiquinone) 1 beta subcomplex subunit 7
MGHGHYDMPERVSHEELVKHKVPLANRDSCAGKLIPLNKCREATGYMPWRCEAERHDYEHCHYAEYHRRMDLMKEKRAEEKAAAAGKK